MRVREIREVFCHVTVSSGEEERTLDQRGFLVYSYVREEVVCCRALKIVFRTIIIYNASKTISNSITYIIANQYVDECTRSAAIPDLIAPHYCSSGNYFIPREICDHDHLWRRDVSQNGRHEMNISRFETFSRVAEIFWPPASEERFAFQPLCRLVPITRHVSGVVGKEKWCCRESFIRLACLTTWQVTLCFK